MYCFHWCPLTFSSYLKRKKKKRKENPYVVRQLWFEFSIVKLMRLKKDWMLSLNVKMKQKEGSYELLITVDEMSGLHFQWLIAWDSYLTRLGIFFFSTYEDGVNLTWQYLISCTLFLLTHSCHNSGPQSGWLELCRVKPGSFHCNS